MVIEKVEHCLNIKFYAMSNHIVTLDSQNMQQFFLFVTIKILDNNMNKVLQFVIYYIEKQRLKKCYLRIIT